MARKSPVLDPTRVRTAASTDYIEAVEAAQLLGVKIRTLYSYVSLGAIRSITQKGTRKRLYYREDIDRAAQKYGGRGGMPETVEAVLRWGQPVIDSSITEITDSGPFYRGRLSTDLSESGRTFESVAELLWSGVDTPFLKAWHIEPVTQAVAQQIELVAKSSGAPTTQRLLSLATGITAMHAPAAMDYESGSTITDARSLINTFIGTIALLTKKRRFRHPTEGGSMARSLLESLGSGKYGDMHEQAMNCAMILCADHELSPATWAARVCASSGAELSACLLASLSTQSGALLGATCDRSEEMLRKARTPAATIAAITSLAKAGRKIPGFNMVGYPKGDPRARQLLKLAAEIKSRSGEHHQIIESIHQAEAKFDLTPSLEAGLTALAVALELPLGSASAILTISRAAGWVAHVIEQRQAAFLIRPRARYLRKTDSFTV